MVSPQGSAPGDEKPPSMARIRTDKRIIDLCERISDLGQQILTIRAGRKPLAALLAERKKLQLELKDLTRVPGDVA